MEAGREELGGVTGGVPERFVPEEMHGQLVEAEHVVRYTWATQFCAGRRVLDAGCGIGYGAQMLAAAAAVEVAAVDIAAAVIEVAAARVDGVDFQVADLAALPYDRARFDVVVCFEAIEHVPEPDVVLDELSRVLAPGGVLLISSPNRSRYVPGNPHHHHEYQPRELEAALRTRFRAVRLLQQHVMLASVLSAERAEGEKLPEAVVRRFTLPGSEDETYTVALAGESLPPSGLSHVGLTQLVELRRTLEHIDAQKDHIERQQQLIDELQLGECERLEALSLLAEHEQALAEVPALRTRADRAEAELERALTELERALTEVAALGERLRLSEGSLAGLRRSRALRAAAVVRRARRLMGPSGGR